MSSADFSAPVISAGGDTALSEELFDIRPLMATFPTGVGIVMTRGVEGRPWGMTCTSVCSVTLRPPTLLVSLRSASPTLQALLVQSEFALNLLHERARAIAELFASGDPDRFDRVAWHLPAGCGGPHLLDAAHAIADCRVRRTEPVGDHTVVFAEVVRARRQVDPHPLLYGLRRYAAWPGSDGT
jgi:flavin reductase (DIM6/NTAB) family NADH-FMN oxidoreductase RutF